MTIERRRLRFDDWEDVIADAEMLRDHGYDHASHGTLSLGQITSHLATVMSGAVDGYHAVVEAGKDYFRVETHRYPS